MPEDNQELLSTLSKKLSSVESKIASHDNEIERMYKGDTRAFKMIIASMAAMIGVGGLIIPVYNLFSAIRTNDRFFEESKRQEERVSKLILDSEKKIDSYTGSLKVESVRVSGTNTDEDLVDGRPEVSKIKIENSDAVLYEANVRFYVNIEIKGEGVGKIIGIRVKYAGKFAQLMSKNADNRSDDFMTRFYGNGMTYYFSTTVVEGFPNSLNWATGTRRKTCGEAFGFLRELAKDNNLGYLEITPVMEQIQKKPEIKKLKISVGENYSILNCDEIEKNKPEKSESPQSVVSPSTSPIGKPR